MEAGDDELRPLLLMELVEDLGADVVVGIREGAGPDDNRHAVAGAGDVRVELEVLGGGVDRELRAQRQQLTAFERLHAWTTPGAYAVEVRSTVAEGHEMLRLRKRTAGGSHDCAGSQVLSHPGADRTQPARIFSRASGSLGHRRASGHRGQTDLDFC